MDKEYKKKNNGIRTRNKVNPRSNVSTKLHVKILIRFYSLISRRESNGAVSGRKFGLVFVSWFRVSKYRTLVTVLDWRRHP